MITHTICTVYMKNDARILKARICFHCNVQWRTNAWRYWIYNASRNSRDLGQSCWTWSDNHGKTSISQRLRKILFWRGKWVPMQSIIVTLVFWGIYDNHPFLSKVGMLHYLVYHIETSPYHFDSSIVVRPVGALTSKRAATGFGTQSPCLFLGGALVFFCTLAFIGICMGMSFPPKAI